MFVLAAAIFGAEQDMTENVDGLFDSIFGIFENLIEIGEGWGEPWGWLFPTLVALGVVLAFAAGIQSVFSTSASKIRPIFVFALAVVGLLAFAAMREAEENSLGPVDDPAAVSDPSG